MSLLLRIAHAKGLLPRMPERKLPVTLDEYLGFAETSPRVAATA